jgi:hypothetical protein
MKIQLRTRILLSACVLALAGCREQTSDLRDLWTTLENDVERKLEGVTAQHRRLQTQVAAVPIPDTTNMEGREARLRADSMVARHERSIQSIQQLLLRDRSRREQLSTSPTRAEMQRAVDSARTEYTRAMNELTTIQQEHETALTLAGIDPKTGQLLDSLTQDSSRVQQK